MVELKTDTSIDAMYEAGQVVARALTAAQRAADVGVSLLELDEVAHGVLREAGATSPFLGYRPSFAPTPFPAVLCVSVNDAIVHGVPDRYRLRDGDLVSIDGNRIGDIAHAIGTICRGAGYGIPDGFGGHGIGRRMHEDPGVPNEGRPGRGMRLRHGMVLAIEPMVVAGGTDDFHAAPDGWTLKTNDGSRAAHAEHTVAITDAGPRILTAR